MGPAAASAVPTASSGDIESGASTMAVDEELPQRVLAAEQHFALVGEVAEERPLGQSRALGDLGDGRLVESAFGVELERRLLQATARVGLPPTHVRIVRE